MKVQKLRQIQAHYYFFLGKQFLQCSVEINDVHRVIQHKYRIMHFSHDPLSYHGHQVAKPIAKYAQNKNK